MRGRSGSGAAAATPISPEDANRAIAMRYFFLSFFFFFSILNPPFLPSLHM
jgi:hypothetical protein